MDEEHYSDRAHWNRTRPCSNGIDERQAANKTKSSKPTKKPKSKSKSKPRKRNPPDSFSFVPDKKL